MKFSNVFEVLRISCFATKREIENSFLNWCGDIDETEAKIQKAIKMLSNPTLNIDLHKIDSDIKSDSIENINPEIRERILKNKVAELEQWSKTFKELGTQYERIMDGNIDTRFQYITETMDLYAIAKVGREDTTEDITAKICKRIDSCYFDNIENDENGENARKNEIEILERIKLLLTDPEKRKQYDEALRKREEEKARTDAKKGKNVISFTRAISRVKEAKASADSRVSDPDAVLKALFGEDAARVPSRRTERNGEPISPIFAENQPTRRSKPIEGVVSPIFEKQANNQAYNRAPVRAMRDEHDAHIQGGDRRAQKQDGRTQSTNMRTSRPNGKNPQAKQKTTQEKRKQKFIKGVKRITAGAVALLVAGGIQYGKQAENDISLGGKPKTAVIEMATITPDFMPAGVATPTPTPTVTPTPAPVEYDTMLEAYQGLPEGSLYKKVFEQAVLEMTGVKDGSNIEAFIQIMDNNYKAGTDVVTVAEFNRLVGVGLIKAGVAESLYLEDGRVLETDDIVIRQTEANRSTRLIANGEEMFKTDWSRSGDGSIKPYSNEPMTEKMANDIDYLSKLYDATGADKIGVELNTDACIVYTPVVYRRNLSICEDVTNGKNPYGIVNGKIGIEEQRPQTQRTISMEDVLKEDDSIGLE